jgi:hypothetical protein
MGLMWGLAWSLAGGILARVPGFDSDLPFPLLFAPLGFAAGIVFSGILAASERGRGFDRLSLARFATWGVAGGLLLSGIPVVGAILRGGAVWSEFLLFGPALAIASGACAAGSLALARRAERQAFPGSAGDPAGADVTDGEKRGVLGRGD